MAVFVHSAYNKNNSLGIKEEITRRRIVLYGKENQCVWCECVVGHIELTPFFFAQPVKSIC